MNLVIFGGSGYIGSFLANHFLEKSGIDKIYIFDIQETKINHPKVIYKNIDVRKEIHPDIVECEISWIFNLAAVHREPGHEKEEYFDTNINGAENVCKFAEALNCKNIYFTSSIATYGKSREMKNENSSMYPETPYGISKLLAEKIHQIWLNKSNDRRLIICRPSVIFGPNDPGNIYRMIKAIKKGYFFFPGDPNITKSFGYIYGLIESIDFTMNKDDKLIIYNYAENPTVTLKELTNIIKKVINKQTIVLKIPISLLLLAANIITLFNKNSSIHPVRVKKAAFPTHIQPYYLINTNFKFNYSLDESFHHWRKVLPSDFS